MSRINCLQCKHYQNTWDKYLPRGCKLYNLKSYANAFTAREERKRS